MDNLSGEHGLTAVLGAVALKVAEKLFGLKRRNMDEATKIRQELREEVKRLNEKITEVYSELGDWRERYYQQLEVNAELRAQCALLKGEIQALRVATGVPRPSAPASSNPES